MIRDSLWDPQIYFFACLRSLDLSQMVLASENQLKPIIIILLYNFGFYNFAEKPNHSGDPTVCP